MMQINCSATSAIFKYTVTVEQAAKQLGCSARRVRALLAQKRLSGELVGKSWIVEYPLRYTLASKGPLLKIASVYRTRPKRTRQISPKKKKTISKPSGTENFDILSILNHNVSHT